MALPLAAVAGTALRSGVIDKVKDFAMEHGPGLLSGKPGAGDGLLNKVGSMVMESGFGKKAADIIGSGGMPRSMKNDGGLVEAAQQGMMNPPRTAGEGTDLKGKMLGTALVQGAKFVPGPIGVAARVADVVVPGLSDKVGDLVSKGPGAAGDVVKSTVSDMLQPGGLSGWRAGREAKSVVDNVLAGPKLDGPSLKMGGANA